MTSAIGDSTKISAVQRSVSPSTEGAQLGWVLLMVCVGLAACAVLAWVCPDFPLTLQELPIGP